MDIGPAVSIGVDTGAAKRHIRSLDRSPKAHADGIVTGASLTVTQTNSSDAFWEAVTAFHTAMPAWIAKLAATAYVIMDGSLYFMPATFPGYNASEVNGFMQPFVAQLQRLAINYTTSVNSFDNYYPSSTPSLAPYPMAPTPMHRSRAAD